jgi:SANT/Myb-like domain of DAMP1
MQEETDYLLDLCERLDLRFVVVADRYDFPGGRPRSLEDLKGRYYALAAELTKARAGEPLLAANQPLVRSPYDAQKERERREFLRMSLARNPAQVRTARRSRTAASSAAVAALCYLPECPWCLQHTLVLAGATLTGPVRLPNSAK